MDTHKVAYAVVLTAIVVVLSPFSIPVGPAKAFPAQHMVNLLAWLCSALGMRLLRRRQLRSSAT